MATTIKPLHDRVILRRIEDTTNQTAGGLFIPDSAKEKPQEGEVIAVGDGKYKEDGSRQTLDVKDWRPRSVRKIQRFGNQNRRRRIIDYA